MVSKVLYSDHPITWAWADIYALRPVRGPHEPTQQERTRQLGSGHWRRGVRQQEHFALWLGGYDESNWFPEIRRLRAAGFDSVKYACEVLKRTIQWEIRSKYDGPDGDKGPEGKSELGFTMLVPQLSTTEPFKIRIGLAAEGIWPLLVQDYSTAEKAACSFTLAATMLHELTVSRATDEILPC